MARILVVGGAGFIGSHMMKTLAKAGHEAVALDDLSTGHAGAVIYGELVEGDLAKTDHVKVGPVRVDPRYFHPDEVETLLGAPTLANDKLGWVATTTLDEMVDETMGHDLDQAKWIRVLRERGFDVALDQE